LSGSKQVVDVVAYEELERPRARGYSQEEIHSDISVEVSELKLVYIKLEDSLLVRSC
jgi:hypothetical protein